MSNQIFKIGENTVRDGQFVESIVKHTNFTMEEAMRITAYNVITPVQLSLLTNKSISAIQNLMVPKQTPEGIVPMLTKVYPFMTKDVPGPIFIEFNEKCKKYIQKAVKKLNPYAIPKNR